MYLYVDSKNSKYYYLARLGIILIVQPAVFFKILNSKNKNIERNAKAYFSSF